jgi:hypothetical protein
VQSVAVNLEPGQYLSGWRPENGSLFVPALSESRVGEEVAIRVGIYGQTIRATVYGKIAVVRRVGRPSLPPGVELSLDRASLPAAGFLAMAARGEPVSFQERAPRFAIARPVLLVRERVDVRTATYNISDGGCAVDWQGPLPMVGEVLTFKLGDGIFAASARAVVCWNAVGGTVPRGIGLRLVGEGRALRSWKAVVAEAARSGARAA